MEYDTDKYRQKREKVLGITGKGIGFGTLSLTCSLVILTGLAWLIGPGTLKWWTDRHMVDAIYRMKGGEQWAPEIVSALETIPGVTYAFTDKEGTRLIVTFDKTNIDVSRFTSHFEARGINAVLLNTMPHHQQTKERKEE